jgi:chorismate mutase
VSGEANTALRIEVQGDEATLQRLREEIDKQDRALLDILARRFSLVSTITRLKRAEDIPLRDLERERHILEDRIKHGESAGLDAILVARIFEVVLSHSARLQRRLVPGLADFRREGEPDPCYATALVLKPAGDAEGLARSLRGLQQSGVALYSLHALRAPRENDLVFLVFVQGTESASPLREALGDLRRDAELVRVLGSYPTYEPLVPLALDSAQLASLGPDPAGHIWRDPPQPCWP